MPASHTWRQELRALGIATCHACAFSFPTLQTVVEHDCLSAAVAGGGDPRLKCRRCQRTFVRQEFYTFHKKVCAAMAEQAEEEEDVHCVAVE